MLPVSNVDEIIETEVCNRLIRLSCAKMVNSKSERGGAKLHRNLLILHLLRKARDEQKRFPIFANSPEWMEGPGLGESSMMMQNANPLPVLDTFSPSHHVGMDDEENEVDNVICGNTDVGATHLLDLSNGHEIMQLDNSCGSVVMQEQTEFGYSTVRLAPLQYTFDGSEMYGADETTQQHMYNDFAYFSEEMVSAQSFSRHAKEIEEELEGFATQKSGVFSSDCFAVSEETTAASVSESASVDEKVCSCIDNDHVKDGNSRNSSPCSAASLHHRKRKTSALRLPSSCSVKKCCVEERQLTGLISVFNSGLSVVADQFLARPSVPSVSPLQQTPKQINSFLHITCNPLIC